MAFKTGPWFLVLTCMGSVTGGVPSDDRPDYYKNRNQLAVRTSGVKLDTMVEVRTVNGKAEVAVHWALDYNGPRKPLIILEPSLDRQLQAQTRLFLYASGKDKKRYEIHFTTPEEFKAGTSKKEWFAKVEDKLATGTLVIPVKDIRRDFIKYWPTYDWTDNPPPMHLQLVHVPLDRGEEFDLDAWTGELIGPMMSLNLEKW